VILREARPRSHAVDRGSREHPGLAHAAAQSLAQFAGTVHGFRRAGNGGSHRGGEPLGKAHGNRVESRGKITLGFPGRDRRIPEPGAVAVRAQIERPRRGQDTGDVPLRKHAAPRAIVGVLHDQQRGRRRVQLVPAITRRDRRVGHTFRERHQVELHPGKRCGGARFVDEDV